MAISPAVAVSESFGDYCELFRIHKEAFHILQIGQKLNLDIAFSDDLTLELALTQTADTSYLRLFVNKTLGSLMEYDRKNNTNLIQTVQSLAEHMGIRTQTAQALYLHRNTLLSRIQKIESLTGMDLSRNEDLYKISFAFKISKLLDPP